MKKMKKWNCKRTQHFKNVPLFYQILLTFQKTSQNIFFYWFFRFFFWADFFIFFTYFFSFIFSFFHFFILTRSYRAEIICTVQSRLTVSILNKVTKRVDWLQFIKLASFEPPPSATTGRRSRATATARRAALSASADEGARHCWKFLETKTSRNVLTLDWDRQ